MAVVTHDVKHLTICTTPKVACTEILEYVRWVEVGPPDACPFVDQRRTEGLTHFKSHCRDVRLACARAAVECTSQKEETTHGNNNSTGRTKTKQNKNTQVEKPNKK